MPELTPFYYAGLVFLAGLGLRTLARFCDVGFRIKAPTWSLEFIARPKSAAKPTSAERPPSAAA